MYSVKITNFHHFLLNESHMHLFVSQVPSTTIQITYRFVHMKKLLNKSIPTQCAFLKASKVFSPLLTEVSRCRYNVTTTNKCTHSGLLEPNSSKLQNKIKKCKFCKKKSPWLNCVQNKMDATHIHRNRLWPEAQFGLFPRVSFSSCFTMQNTMKLIRTSFYFYMEIFLFEENFRFLKIFFLTYTYHFYL
jgi:hypothetical protein